MTRKEQLVDSILRTIRCVPSASFVVAPSDLHEPELLEACKGVQAAVYWNDETDMPEIKLQQNDAIWAALRTAIAKATE